MFRLLPRGFTNRDLRPTSRRNSDCHPRTCTSGQITYDLRRLRAHGLIERIPHTHRYRVTDHGLRAAHCSSPAPTTGFCAPASPRSRAQPAPTKLRAATRAYDSPLTTYSPAPDWQPDQT